MGRIFDASHCFPIVAIPFETEIFIKQIHNILLNFSQGLMERIDFVFPGETVSAKIEHALTKDLEMRKKSSELASIPSLKLGPGLIQINNHIWPLRPGMLTFHSPDKFWVSSREKRV